MALSKGEIGVEEQSYHSKRHNGVKLVPEPSSDPADPLVFMMPVHSCYTSSDVI